MYRMRPPAVYAHESVLADPRCRARLERVTAALVEPVEPTVYADDELPALIREKGLLAGRVPMGTLGEIPDPALLFNTFRFDGRREEREKRLAAEADIKVGGYHTRDALLGHGPFAWFVNEGDRVCRNCWRLHFQNGCAHKCHYCSFGGLLVTMANVEAYVERLDGLIAAHPWQETYLFEDDADVLCLEPELGCVGPVIEHFGKLKDRYLIIHTKSANVDWMLDLEHRGNTIIVWSVSGPTQSEKIEPVTGSTVERIEAAHRAERAGYTVRYKFKPIVPVRDWRKDAAETVGMIFERTNPDVISLCVFMWMGVDDMKRRLDVSLLDPEFVRAAEEAAEGLGESRCRPFPEERRAEVYELHLDEIRKRSRGTPVSVSTESPGMWRRLGGRLGAGPGSYVCGCGPNATPWRKALPCDAFEAYAAGPQGGFEKL